MDLERADGPRFRPSRRRVLAATGAIGVGVLGGCAGDGGEPAAPEGHTPEPDGRTDAPGGAGGESTATVAGWQRTELTDVLTEESFAIEGLSGPVAIQAFAVWCSSCQRQSEELARMDGSVTRVGLNMDPNEDAEKVRGHAERNGWDWRFAVAPSHMTESLVEEFGPTVTNPPSTPIIVVCDDGRVAEFFSGSQQSVEDIATAAAEC